jgi:CysZ protein
MPPQAPAAAAASGALGRGFAALFYPKNMLIMLVSAVVSIFLAIALWHGLKWALLGNYFNWGWLNWTVRAFGNVALVFLLFILFPAILAIVTSCFFDAIIGEVEKRHYPTLAKPRHQSPAEIALYIAKFTALLIGVNLLALPLYLFLPIANFVVAWMINGYILGREYFEAVAMRRMTLDKMRDFRRAHGGRVYRGGFAIAVLKTVPILNLVMPVVACAYFTHVFHALDWRPKAAPGQV